jgi:hypothetical protein
VTAGSESRRAIFSSIGANAAIAITKIRGWMHSTQHGDARLEFNSVRRTKALAQNESQRCQARGRALYSARHPTRIENRCAMTALGE